MDCDGEGGYNKSASTTGKWLDETFNINNTDMGLAVSGEMVSDTLTFAGASMDNVNMPIIEGFSFASSKSKLLLPEDSQPLTDAFLDQLSIGYGDDKNSTSLTRELASAGAIQSEAFSLYNSTILFGGVNKDKWEDELYTFPIINATSDNKPEHIAISIDGISINANDTLADEFPMSAILDNGYYMTYVPKSVAQSLNSQIKGASAPDAYGMVNLSCSAVNEGDMIQFRIGYLDLNLKLLDFINTVAWGSNHNPPTDKNKNETCYFQILEYTSLEDVGVYLGEKDVLLGDNFLRNVYSVFDLTNDEVSLASLNSDPLIGDNIVEITAGEVPGASPGDSDSAGVRIGEGLSTSALVATAAVLLFAL